ncbi:MAG: hypothetical protein ABIS23_02425 [Sphingomicrobium sp.]
MKLSRNWDMIDDGVLHFDWRETTARPVDAKQRDGSTGLTLIRRMLGAHGGTLDIDWRSDGLDIRVAMPGF